MQVASALLHAHECGVVHRDIKLENLVVAAGGRVKLVDFGHSIASSRWTKRPTNTPVGTLEYVAPEMLARQEQDSTVDVWSLGILIHELLVGCAPFEDAEPELTSCRVDTMGDLEIPEEIEDEAADLITKLLVRIPEDRMHLEDVLKHPWIVKHTDSSDYGGLTESINQLKVTAADRKWVAQHEKAWAEELPDCTRALADCFRETADLNELSESFETGMRMDPPGWQAESCCF